MFDSNASAVERAKGAIETMKAGSVLANQMIDAAQTVLPKSTEKALNQSRYCVNQLQSYANFSGYALNTLKIATKLS